MTASFNMYCDTQELYMYIENSGQWFMGLYEENGNFAKIPAIRDTSTLVKIQDVCQYEFEDLKVTNCKFCSNDGFYWDTFDDRFEICDCYHGKCHGEQSLEDYIDGIKEAHALRNVL